MLRKNLFYFVPLASFFFTVTWILSKEVKSNFFPWNWARIGQRDFQREQIFKIRFNNNLKGNYALYVKDICVYVYE